MDLRDFEVGKSIQGRRGWYRCVQHLGTGKNATTLLVLQTEGSNRGLLFALKGFQRLSSHESRHRFLEETDFLMTCDHPSIMRVYDTGEFGRYDDKFPFVVAEYLPTTLGDLIRSRQGATVEKISYALQLLAALKFLAHLDPAVVHRDVKPENIFVKGRSCVLGDFGLMKRLGYGAEDDRAIFRESIGAVMPSRYRTPDLIAYAKSGGSLTPASDIFQLGIVLAELFTGENPIEPHREDVLEPIWVNRIAHVPGSLGASIAAVLRRMLEIDVDKRPSHDDLISQWQSNFFNAAERATELEGFAF